MPGLPATPAYCGRFAPSPTGPLHFGSLVAAVASYLDARSRNGTWRVRMEDLDGPRCTPGAAEDILRTLEAHGLEWDDAVLYQSRRNAAYEAAMQRLRDSGMAYPCACTRKEIADSAVHGIDGQVYPGTCRAGVPPGRIGRAWRVRTDCAQAFDAGTAGQVSFEDALQGRIAQHLEQDIGDFVVRRADGLFAYQLAVVVDDAFQGITHVVRGADLLASTPRQIYLQRLLGFPTPHYMHVPVALDAAGEKLSKQTRALPVGCDDPAGSLWRALVFLRQSPPDSLRDASASRLLQWAVANWRPQLLAGVGAQSVKENPDDAGVEVEYVS